MKKVLGIFLAFSLLVFIACDKDEDDTYIPQEEQQADLVFEDTLSEMGIFQGELRNLTPAEGVVLYELNSKLFTDYAKKQRLIRLPEGGTMQGNGSNLQPDFPDNTLISKTFYYNVDDRDPSLGQQIIETRVFIKVDGVWQSGEYVWNEEQTDATYRETSSVKPISYIDDDGTERNIDYVIPAITDCATCHNNNNVTAPIGFKLRSLNYSPNNGNGNQLNYFINQGLLTGVDPSTVSVLPDWTDTENFDLFDRSRAYIDINCAHCHQPGGSVTNFDMDFRYETPFEDTFIYQKRGQIESRIQSTVPTFMMPQIGRTVVHDEAVDMLIQYLDEIEL